MAMTATAVEIRMMWVRFMGTAVLRHPGRAIMVTDGGGGRKLRGFGYHREHLVGMRRNGNDSSGIRRDRVDDRGSGGDLRRGGVAGVAFFARRAGAGSPG